MKSVLITGCHGLTGQKLVELFSGYSHNIYGIDLHQESIFQGMAGYQYHQFDLTNRSKLLDLIEELSPDVIINTAAMTQVDACEIEKERCWKINVDVVRYLVESARRFNMKLIHISSDYVFDGTAGPYNELDRPNPISYYGKSKLASENLIFGGGIDSAVLRTMVLFGHGRNLKPSFVSWIVTKLREGVTIKIVTDQIGNVTLVDDLADSIHKIVTMNISGLFHVAGREIISRYDFAVNIAEAYNLNKEYINPTITRLLGQVAPRPLQSGLIVDKAQRELMLNFCDVDEALRKYRKQEASFN
ncbi:MAG: SDR family oxidoreductase [Candidatus Electryonea clarkiae]|nr:SDR family oxidoreductase [Candidatus Electryonea clarkiae]MDP8286038.1 SDR family oxidoreductase [Candidatus Electryonea clarkiae]